MNAVDVALGIVLAVGFLGWLVERERREREEKFHAAQERGWQRSDLRLSVSYAVYDWLSCESMAFRGYHPWPEPTTAHERVFAKELDRLRAEVPAFAWPNVHTTDTKERMANIVADRLIRADEEAKRVWRWPWQKQTEGPFLTDEIHKARLARLSSASTQGILDLQHRAAMGDVAIRIQKGDLPRTDVERPSD
jgi:hypothetical protein